MSVVEIPLAGEPESFEITLGIVPYNLTVKWNYISSTWMLDIADQTNNPLVQGIPMIPGGDLLGQYEYLGIEGKLIVQTDGNPDAPPTYDNLGTASHLYYVTND